MFVQRPAPGPAQPANQVMTMYAQHKKRSPTTHRVTNPAFPGSQPVNSQLIAAMYPAGNSPISFRPAQTLYLTIETEAIAEVNRNIGRWKNKLKLSQFVTGYAERLLDHHCLSRPYRLQRHPGVKIIGRGNRERI